MHYHIIGTLMVSILCSQSSFSLRQMCAMKPSVYMHWSDQIEISSLKAFHPILYIVGPTSDCLLFKRVTLYTNGFIVREEHKKKTSPNLFNVFLPNLICTLYETLTCKFDKSVLHLFRSWALKITDFPILLLTLHEKFVA